MAPSQLLLLINESENGIFIGPYSRNRPFLEQTNFTSSITANQILILVTWEIIRYQKGNKEKRKRDSITNRKLNKFKVSDFLENDTQRDQLDLIKIKRNHFMNQVELNILTGWIKPILRTSLLAIFNSQFYGSCAK